MGKKILANDGIDAAGKALLEKAGFTAITKQDGSIIMRKELK